MQTAHMQIQQAGSMRLQTIAARLMQMRHSTTVSQRKHGKSGTMRPALMYVGQNICTPNKLRRGVAHPTSCAHHGRNQQRRGNAREGAHITPAEAKRVRKRWKTILWGMRCARDMERGQQANKSIKAQSRGKRGRPSHNQPHTQRSVHPSTTHARATAPPTPKPDQPIEKNPASFPGCWSLSSQTYSVTNSPTPQKSISTHAHPTWLLKHSLIR